MGNLDTCVKGAVSSIPSIFSTVKAASTFSSDSSKGKPKNPFCDDESASAGGNGDKGLTRRQRFNFIAEVVEETAAALVYIEIKDAGVRDYFSGEPVTSSNGSGFIIDPEGLILTNAHVVIKQPRSNVQVRLQDGRTFQGQVEDVDIRSDWRPCGSLLVTSRSCVWASHPTSDQESSSSPWDHLSHCQTPSPQESSAQWREIDLSLGCEVATFPNTCRRMLRSHSEILVDP